MNVRHRWFDAAGSQFSYPARWRSQERRLTWGDSHRTSTWYFANGLANAIDGVERASVAPASAHAGRFRWRRKSAAGARLITKIIAAAAPPGDVLPPVRTLSGQDTAGRLTELTSSGGVWLPSPLFVGGRTSLRRRRSRRRRAKRILRRDSSAEEGRPGRPPGGPASKPDQRHFLGRPPTHHDTARHRPKAVCLSDGCGRLPTPLVR